MAEAEDGELPEQPEGLQQVFDATLDSDQRCYRGHGKLEYFFPSAGRRIADLFLDDESKYSVSEEAGANAMTDLLRAHVPAGATIMDATACIGGNTFSAQKHFPTVAVEIDPLRNRILRSNMAVLGATNVTHYLEQDLVAMLEADAMPHGVPDRLGAIIIDAPWGGTDYMRGDDVELFMSDRPLSKVVELCLKLTGVVMLKVPKNYRKAGLIQDMRPLNLISALEARLKKYDILVLVFESARDGLPSRYSSHFDHSVRPTSLYELKVWLPPHYQSSVTVTLQSDRHLDQVRRRNAGDQPGPNSGPRGGRRYHRDDGSGSYDRRNSSGQPSAKRHARRDY
eukprot:m.22096 g.22096  ORF g.22096 m.22096 type:complete len:339 (-) comp11201_c0_seq1:67-1083(-)